jgi:hypothetical protein
MANPVKAAFKFGRGTVTRTVDGNTVSRSRTGGYVLRPKSTVHVKDGGGRNVSRTVIGGGMTEAGKNITAVLGAGGVGAAGYAHGRHYVPRKQTRTVKVKVKKGYEMGVDPFEVSKVGDWKTIDQRSLKAAGARKKQRRALGVAGLAGGAGLALATRGKAVPEAQQIARKAKISYRAHRLLSPTSGVAGAGRTVFRSSMANPSGGALLGAGAVTGGALGVAGSQRGVEAYHQHKINQRRRANRSKTVSKSNSVSAFGVEHPDSIAKYDMSKPSKGRVATGAAFPGYHGAIAGKKGKKLRAMGREMGGAYAGSLGGSLAGLAVTGGRSRAASIGGGTVGGLAGAALGTASAHRMGHYQKQEKKR